MGLPSLVLGLLTLAGAVMAMTLRNLVHCLLGLALSFVGLAGLYLALSASFVGLVQILVYVGAVAILMVFAILLTRGGEASQGSRRRRSSWVAGFGAALAVFGGLAAAVVWGPAGAASTVVEPSVKYLGERLLTDYVLPLQVMGLLLTAALIGAVIVAMPPAGSASSTTNAQPGEPDRSPAPGSAGEEARS